MILDPGDVVVFYSDGIGDAQNSAGDFFGYGRVATILSSHLSLPADGIADKILEAADAFSGGKHPSDDRTLVVLKVR
jgi:sigma-B regulation protein RsbU (phosphoserine phosphatase)